jgi:hypothetical protein
MFSGRSGSWRCSSSPLNWPPATSACGDAITDPRPADCRLDWRSSIRRRRRQSKAASGRGDSLTTLPHPQDDVAVLSPGPRKGACDHLEGGSATTNPAPAVAPAPLATPSSPTINPATSPAHIGKVAVEASDHALSGRHSDRGGRGRKARREQKSCEPEGNDGFLHDSSLPLRAMYRDDNTGIAPRALSCG